MNIQNNILEIKLHHVLKISLLMARTKVRTTSKNNKYVHVIQHGLQSYSPKNSNGKITLHVKMIVLYSLYSGAWLGHRDGAWLRHMDEA